MRVLLRSEISGPLPPDNPSSGGRHKAANKPPSQRMLPPTLGKMLAEPSRRRDIQWSASICHESSTGLASTWIHSSSPVDSSFANVPVMPASGSTSKVWKVLIGKNSDAVKVISVVYVTE